MLQRRLWVTIVDSFRAAQAAHLLSQARRVIIELLHELVLLSAHRQHCRRSSSVPVVASPLLLLCRQF